MTTTRLKSGILKQKTYFGIKKVEIKTEKKKSNSNNVIIKTKKPRTRLNSGVLEQKRYFPVSKSITKKMKVANKVDGVQKTAVPYFSSATKKPAFGESNKTDNFDEAGATNSHESNRCTEVQFGAHGEFSLTSLSSYPGSGNTWVRYLIEEYTGYYTGSIYSDNNLFRGGFKGEKVDWKAGTTVVVKAHSFKDDRNLNDSILLIRSPYDAILAEFNRLKGQAKGGDHHTGLASLDDFLSEDWKEMDMGRRANRWAKLYTANLLNRRTLPIFYEDLKREPIPEMRKIGEFLNQIAPQEERFDCMFGDHSKKFKRSSDREYDPWSFISVEKFERINDSIRRLNTTIYNVHGIMLPDSYLRAPPSQDA